MTLIIMFESAPVIIGDLMVSSKADTHPIKIVKKDGALTYSAFPMQKIVSIQPGVYMACSGSVGDTKKIIGFASGLHWPTIPPGGFNPAEAATQIRPLVEKIAKYYEDEGLGPGPSRQFPLQMIFYSNGYLFSAGAARLRTPVGAAHVIGSGVEDFQRHLQGPFNHLNKWAFPGQDCMVFALSFFVQYLTQRTSLRNRWGWGMEMLLDGEQKKDRILLQAFLWEKSDDSSEPRFEQVGDKIFSYYRGDVLNVLKQRVDGHWVARKKRDRLRTMEGIRLGLQQRMCRVHLS